MPASEREVDGDISTAPGLDDRRHDTHEGTDATGHGLAAGPDAMKQAPGKERPALQGQPLKCSGETHGRSAHGLGEGDGSLSRASDAEGPGRLAAKDRHPRIRALVRRYGYRVQEG